MLYSVSLTIPPNTAKENYASANAIIAPGTIVKIDLRFPPGCSGLARVAIFHGGAQLWPDSVNNWLFGDRDPIIWDEDFRVSGTPFILEIRGYNLDNLHPHTPTVYINVLTGSKFWQEHLTKLLVSGRVEGAL